MTIRYRQAIGFTLLEFVVGLTITSVIAAALATNIFRQTTNFFYLREAAHKYENLEAITKIAERIMRDFDTHPLPLNPIVHSTGQITLADGSSLSISNLNQSSSAITTIRLRYDQMLEIVSLEQEFNRIVAQACRSYPIAERESPVELRQALLLHPEFVAEAYATYSILPGQPDCYNLELRPANGMFTSETIIAKLTLAKRVIPIEWIRTYYLDSADTLRIVGHVGSQLIFNQPVFSKSRAFKFEVLNSPLIGHIQLSLKLLPDAENDEHIVVQHNVPRITALNLILNL